MKSLLPLGMLCALMLPGFRAEAAEDRDLAARALAILKANCHRCHGDGGSAKGGFGFVLDRERLVGRDLVVPGKAEASALYQKVAAGEMPPKSQEPRPSKEDVAVLKSWIDAGAPSAAPATAVPLVAHVDLLRAIRADLGNLEPRQRRFARYFTLQHLANAGRSDEEQQTVVLGLAKLLNSLSWHPRIALPHPVAGDKHLLRIDLRDYKWSARAWERLGPVYPYRLPGAGPETKTIAQMTGSEQAWVRADWFLATASRPPLYHDLLELPSTDRQLERLLNLDVATNIQEETVARAGFNGSGVSKNNRIIERHDSAYGAYWRSYDFADNLDRSNIFKHPLGPAPGQESFQPAGGEIIFHLPNGLQGYLLVDRNGRRIDQAPVEIVSDPKRPDRKVEVGISCMSCHVRGVIPKSDQLRAHVLKNADAFAKGDVATVRALHPLDAKMQAFFKEDMARFEKALGKLGVKPDQDDPISTATLRYEGEVDLAGAAAEAGLPAAEFAERLGKSPGLNRTLGGLRVKGGTVQREAFQKAFEELARELKLGETGDGSRTGPARPFAGHTETITCIAIAGQKALSGAADKTIRLWEIETGKELLRLEGHADEVTAVAIEGDRAISGSKDRTLRLWDLRSGQEVRQFKGHTDRIRGVAFVPKSSRILSCSDDGSLRLWDAEKGTELKRFEGHTGAVAAIAVSSDGLIAASAGYDRTVRLWELESGKALRTLEGHTREVYAVAFSPDGGQLLSGGNDKTVRQWDVKTGEALLRLEGHANAVIAVAFAPDGKRIFSCSSQYREADRSLRVWDAAKGDLLHELAEGERIGCAAFAPDGAFALTGSAEQILRLWKWPK